MDESSSRPLEVWTQVVFARICICNCFCVHICIWICTCIVSLIIFESTVWTNQLLKATQVVFSTFLYFQVNPSLFLALILLSRSPNWAELIEFFKPTTKIGEVILKSESVLSWCSWLFCITCRSSWKGRFGERSWHEINVSLIQKYKLKRTSWDEIRYLRLQCLWNVDSGII